MGRRENGREDGRSVVRSFGPSVGTLVVWLVVWLVEGDSGVGGGLLATRRWGLPATRSLPYFR